MAVWLAVAMRLERIVSRAICRVIRRYSGFGLALRSKSMMRCVLCGSHAREWPAQKRRQGKTDGAPLGRKLFWRNRPQTEPVYTLLTKCATAHHLARLGLDEPSRLASLIALVQLRATAAGQPARLEAERGLAELEEAWPALLALDTSEGSGCGGGTTRKGGGTEGELMTRAREAKAKLEISACLAQGAWRRARLLAWCLFFENSD